MTLLPLLLSAPADAHGLWGHIQVTGWAVENMPDDTLRAFLLDDPEVFNALLFGAAFTDTGYADDDPASRAYAEHTHWEPFIDDFIEWVRVNDPPPWDDIESKKRVAFLMGCASHGLQDAIFDSLFLYQVEEHDGAGQAEADPATDGFLVIDGHIRFIPEEYMPMETLLELYAGLGEEITEDVIRHSVGLTTGVYINDTGGQNVAKIVGGAYADQIPWTRDNYLNTAIPGSLRAEIIPTMRHQQAIWARLHGEYTADDAAVFAYPEAPRRLLSGSSASPDSWSTLIFGIGVTYADDLLTLQDADGNTIPFTPGNSRWGPTYTRLYRIQPETDLTPGGWYTATLRAGVETIDGQVSDEEWSVTFQVECDEGNPEDCEDLGEITEPSITGVPEEPADTGITEADGCGCATGSPRQAAWLFALLPLLLHRRRATSRSAAGIIHSP